MFDFASSQRPQKFAPLAGLLVAALTAISVCRLPVTWFSSWSQVLGSAVARVFLVFLAAFISNLGFYRRSRAHFRATALTMAMQGALTSLWLAPLLLLVREGSAWALP